MVKIILTFILILLLLGAAPLLIRVSGRLEERRKKYINGINNFISGSREFTGTVLGRMKGGEKGVIIQFRDEEQRKTIVHRYLFSHKRYRRGAVVRLYYREDNDSMCVISDNPFAFKAFWCAAGYAACIFGAALSVVLAVALVVLMII